MCVCEEGDGAGIGDAGGVMRVVCRYPLALIAEEYGYVPVNIALLVAVLKLSTLAY